MSILASGDNEPAHVAPTSGTEPEVLSVADLMGDEVVMPDVKPHAVEAAKTAAQLRAGPPTQPVPAGVPVKGLTDDLGRAFDAAIHAVGSDGKQLLNKYGFIAKRRGGGSKGAKPTQSKIDTQGKVGPNGTVPPNAADREAAIHQTADVAATLFLTMAQMVGGDEFAPVVDAKTGENEPLFIKDAFKNYFRHAGIVDIPPGVGLAIGLSFFVVKRWNQPKFTERRRGWFGGVRRWWSDFRLRRKMSREADVDLASNADDTAPTANP